MHVEPYTVLAGIYDEVMDYVDHEAWADYIHHMLDEHELNPESVVELGCGTGMFAEEFLRRRHVSYVATDGSEEMLAIARQRLPESVSTVRLVYPGPPLAEAVMGGQRADACILLYDGMNYLLTEQAVEGMLNQVRGMLKPDGFLVFDQSTPANSLNNAEFFEDEDELDEGSYKRTSHYDPETERHTTVFEITTPSGAFVEEHVERAWSFDTIRGVLERSGWTILAAYDGFSLDPADDEAERIHWVVRP